eukprot:354898-Chlamydomonas_euryale.AAC.5
MGRRGREKERGRGGQEALNRVAGRKGLHSQVPGQDAGAAGERRKARMGHERGCNSERGHTSHANTRQN